MNLPEDWIELTTENGIVTLRLPPDWDLDEPEEDLDEEIEEDEDTTSFGPPDEDAPALLVSAMVYEHPSPITPRELPKLLVRRGPIPRKLTETRYLMASTETEERGEQTFVWQLIEQTGEQEFVIVIASYTLEPEAQPDADWIALLETSVTHAKISTEALTDELDDSEPPSL